MKMTATIPKVTGVNLDSQTRCQHYQGPGDIVAIKMKCCGLYFACKDCHVALADHPIAVWPENEWQQKAILCGVCSSEFTIQQYMTSKSHCPACGAQFNPRCQNHYRFYFVV
jgi:uncharacterized CHY-type Zn-finger protein